VGLKVIHRSKENVCWAHVYLTSGKQKQDFSNAIKLLQKMPIMHLHIEEGLLTEAQEELLRKFHKVDKIDSTK
jgi:hypothetical protein